jgi:hypothetical protein
MMKEYVCADTDWLYFDQQLPLVPTNVCYTAVTEMEQLVSDSVHETDSVGLILKLLMVYQKILTTVF